MLILRICPQCVESVIGIIIGGSLTRCGFFEVFYGHCNEFVGSERLEKCQRCLSIVNERLYVELGDWFGL